MVWAVPRPGLTTLSDLTGEYVWKVENFSKLGVDQIRSECFEIGGYAWQLLLFPRGEFGGEFECGKRAADVTVSGSRR